MKVLEFKREEKGAGVRVWLKQINDLAAVGDLKAMAIVTVHSDGSVGTGYSDGVSENILRMLGGLKRLEYRMVELIDEEDE